MLFIDGKWETASSGRTFDSCNPANGEKLGEAADADRNDAERAVQAAQEAFAGLVAYHRVRALRPALRGMAHHDGPARGAGRAHDRRAGQAAAHGAQRGGLRRGLPPLVRRGGQALVRRVHPVGPCRPALRGDAPADRRGRRHHPVELPRLDADPQDRAGGRRRLHHGAEAGRADPSVRRRDLPRPGGGGLPAGRRQPGDDERPDPRGRRAARPIPRCARSASPGRPRWARRSPAAPRTSSSGSPSSSVVTLRSWSSPMPTRSTPPRAPHWSSS